MGSEMMPSIHLEKLKGGEAVGSEATEVQRATKATAGSKERSMVVERFEGSIGGIREMG